MEVQGVYECGGAWNSGIVCLDICVRGIVELWDCGNVGTRECGNVVMSRDATRYDACGREVIRRNVTCDDIMYNDVTRRVTRHILL